MTIGSASKVVLVVVIVTLAAWATVAKLFGQDGETVSEVISDYSAEYPLIPVAAGVLIGHWWPIRSRRGSSLG